MCTTAKSSECLNVAPVVCLPSILRQFSLPQRRPIFVIEIWPPGKSCTVSRFSPTTRNKLLYRTSIKTDGIAMSVAAQDSLFLPSQDANAMQIHIPFPSCFLLSQNIIRQSLHTSISKILFISNTVLTSPRSRATAHPADRTRQTRATWTRKRDRPGAQPRRRGCRPSVGGRSRCAGKTGCAASPAGWSGGKCPICRKKCCQQSGSGGVRAR